MIKKLIRLVAIIALMLVFLVSGCGSVANTGAEIGDLAPDFQLQSTEGHYITLSDLRGSPVILNFWASWCSPCCYEMPFLQQIYEEWQNEGIIILAINSSESQSTIMGFMEDNGFSFPVLMDDGAVSLYYNIVGIPTTFFIDKDGIIQKSKLGSFTSAAQIAGYISAIQ